MNIDSTLAILRRERLLLEHAPHSAQFQDLTTCLLRIFSAARVIPALSPQEVQMYASLALLHDVGKQTIPGEILNKPGPLTREEFENLWSAVIDIGDADCLSSFTLGFRLGVQLTLEGLRPII